MKTFTIYWLGGKKDNLDGDTLIDALNSAGYGGGAVSAIDFYTEGYSDDYIYKDGQWVSFVMCPNCSEYSHNKFRCTNCNEWID